MSSSACLSHHPEAEHLKDSYHYLPSNLLANLLTIPSMYKSYTLEKFSLKKKQKKKTLFSWELKKHFGTKIFRLALDSQFCVGFVRYGFSNVKITYWNLYITDINGCRTWAERYNITIIGSTVFVNIPVPRRFVEFILITFKLNFPQYQSSDVWLPRYPPMGIDVGVFKVADAPTYGYVYTLPLIFLNMVVYLVFWFIYQEGILPL